jgi:environmental stress-induced protein Ves
VPPSLQIIRKTAFTPRPWKNGGGITHEAIRVPAEGDAFVWRVSVAHIETSGPFSDFAAYHRKMVLLKGDGVLLEFADGRRCGLRRVGDLAEFDGALATQCTLLGGPCVDLNLIVSKSHQVAARVQRLAAADESVALHASPTESTLMVGIDEPLAVQSGSGDELTLEPWDLAILSNGTGRVTGVRRPGASADGAVFFATISH